MLFLSLFDWKNINLVLLLKEMFSDAHSNFIQYNQCLTCRYWVFFFKMVFKYVIKRPYWNGSQYVKICKRWAQDSCSILYSKSWSNVLFANPGRYAVFLAKIFYQTWNCYIFHQSAIVLFVIINCSIYLFCYSKYFIRSN